MDEQRFVLGEGRLNYIGEHRLGLDRYLYWQCVDCGDTFPNASKPTRYIGFSDDSESSMPHCNGKQISLCPWCRKDTAPWANGRGR